METVCQGEIKSPEIGMNNLAIIYQATRHFVRRYQPGDVIKVYRILKEVEIRDNDQYLLHDFL